jgi:hypothetical protein
MQDHSNNPSKSSPTADQPAALSGTIETKTSFEELKRKAADDVGTVKEKAKAQVRDAADKAEEIASKQKNIAARYAGSIGSAFEKVGSEIQGSTRRSWVPQSNRSPKTSRTASSAMSQVWQKTLAASSRWHFLASLHWPDWWPVGSLRRPLIGTLLPRRVRTRRKAAPTRKGEENADVRF